MGASFESLHDGLWACFVRLSRKCLHNVVGNVWEWTAGPYRVRSLKRSVKQRLSEMKGYKLSKGGSFLCHRSYCYRYRIAARSSSSPDSSTTHHGFRVVWSD